MSAPKEITDVLGRVRPVVYTYPGGEWNCPFCSAGVSPETPCRGYAGGCVFPVHCPNPACFANPHYPVARAREELAKIEQKEAEERRRKRDHEWSMKRAEDDRKAREAAREALREKAIEIGACVRCALSPSNYKRKLVKHRVACPLEKRR